MAFNSWIRRNLRPANCIHICLTNQLNMIGLFCYLFHCLKICMGMALTWKDSVQELILATLCFWILVFQSTELLSVYKTKHIYFSIYLRSPPVSWIKPSLSMELMLQENSDVTPTLWGLSTACSHSSEYRQVCVHNSPTAPHPPSLSPSKLQAFQLWS